MKPRISMITLGVRDLQKSIDFYEKGLGLPRMDSPGDVAFFTLNGTWLGLYAKQALAEDADVPAEGGGFKSFALAHNLASKEEVDKAFEEALAAGATVAKKPQNVFWGGFPAISKTRTAICGSLPTTPSSGLAQAITKQGTAYSLKP